jgi:hypothetical protein
MPLTRDHPPRGSSGRRARHWPPVAALTGSNTTIEHTHGGQSRRRLDRPERAGKARCCSVCREVRAAPALPVGRPNNLGDLNVVDINTIDINTIDINVVDTESGSDYDD